MWCWTCAICSASGSWTGLCGPTPTAAHPIPALTATGRSSSAPCWTGRWTRGADAMATGHYARVRLDTPSGRWQLLRGADRRKDQTYFLYQLTQHQLAHLLLPVRDYEKPALRALAAANGLSNAQKADSQDICFVPDGDYVSFLRQYGGVEPVPGDFLDSEGRVLGRHRGMECYTIGQRKGLGVSANAPQYVLGKDPDRNAVILGEDNRLYTRELTAERVNWL
ncbi:MAG: tRNA methyl transferase PRC-barrel domain-containing protein, partial [Dysosmobacter welbionis]